MPIGYRRKLLPGLFARTAEPFRRQDLMPLVFIHHDGALGDVILSLPAIGLIRGDNFLHLAARDDIAGFLRKTEFINESTRLSSSFYLPLYTGNQDVHLKRFFSQFEKAFVFSIKEPSIIASSIKKLLPETIEIKTVPDDNTKVNVAEFRLRQLVNKCKIFIPEKIFTQEYASTLLRIPSINIEQAMGFLLNSGYDNESPLIAIHPGSGGAQKCWGIEYFFELVDALLKEYKPFVVILSGHAESASIKAEINNFIKGKRNILHISDNELIMVSSFLSLCDIYLGNDSGISHLASLLSQKVVVIFGPTDPLLWKPPYDNVRVISSDYKCAPCDALILNNCKDKRCLKEITVSRVYEEIVNLFRENG